MGTGMTEMLERVAGAIGRQVAITVRNNKLSSLPFEVIDTSGDEPRVLSAWAEHDVAVEQAQHAALIARARNAIAAMRLPTREMMIAADAAEKDHDDYEMLFYGDAWPVMISAALGESR